MNLSYAWLLTLSGLLTVLGITVLVIAIPGCNILFKSSEAKTEFYSVRAAYWCTILGATVFGLILMGGLVQHILLRFLKGQ